MAITNAQQYQQLVNKPANGKRPGYRGDDAARSERAAEKAGYGGTSRADPDTRGSGPSGTDDRGSPRQNYNTAVATGRNPKGIDLSKGPPPLTEKEKQFVKDNPPKANLLDFLDPRKRFYNYSRNLPGAKKSSYNNLKAYRDYLVSQGADLSTIDRLMEGVDEENAIGFDQFQELAYDYNPKGITDIDKLKDIFNDPTRDPFEKLTAVPQNFSDFMLTQRNNPNLFAAGDLGNFMDKPKPKDLVNPNTGELYTNTEWNDLKRDIGQDRGLIGGGRDNENQQQTDPCLGPNPPAYCAVNNDPADPATPSRNLGGLAARFGGSKFNFDNLADGGRAGAMDGGMMEDTPEGGIMDLESGRQMYFLGKLVKKASKAIKKVVKSPVGKAALMYFGGKALMGAGGGKGLSSFFGKGSFNPLKQLLTGDMLAPGEAPGIGLSKFGLKLSDLGLVDPSKMALTGLGKGALYAGVPAALSYFMTPKDEDDSNLDDYYKTNRLNIADIRNRPFDFLSAANQGSRYNVADGGIMRNGYAEGSKEPVAKKTMPLLDMDGQEMDLREEGGFVPLGRMERADDVPARLSKNEFVFTADAVRNAGEGDVDKGAEVMYNMMKNLESGGEVSEESQGLDGAREMFKTSQRLEEVI